MNDNKKRVRVRIAVAVDENGDWSSAGWGAKNKRPTPNDDDLADIALDNVLGRNKCIHWVEAYIPLPVQPTHFVAPRGAPVAPRRRAKKPKKEQPSGE